MGNNYHFCKKNRKFRCLKCFRHNDLLVDNKTAMELNEKTQQRIEKIRSKNIAVEEIWECEIHAEYNKSPKFKEFMDDLGKEKGPIDPVI